MLLMVIEGSGIQKGADPSYLRDILKPTVVSVGSIPQGGVGIMITKCGKHRDHIAAADNILVFGECTSAPAGSKILPEDTDINKTIQDEWTSMMETDTEEESKEMEG